MHYIDHAEWFLTKSWNKKCYIAHIMLFFYNFVNYSRNSIFCKLCIIFTGFDYFYFLNRWWSQWLDDGRSGFLLLPPNPSLLSLPQCIPSPFAPPAWHPGALWFGGHDISAAGRACSAGGLLPVWPAPRESLQTGQMRQGATTSGPPIILSVALCIIFCF